MAEPTREPRFGEPFFLQWSITDRCNLRCAHCYRDGPTSDLDGPALARLLDDFAAFLSTIGRHGRVMFSGGEPLLSPHLFELAERARTLGLPARVLSNGTLIEPATARALADAGVRAVQVSLEGMRTTHDRVRGTGTFDAALDGARALREAGVEVTVAMTLTSDNLAELARVERLAERIGHRFHVARHVPVGRGAALDAAPLTAERSGAALATLERRRRSLSRRRSTFGIARRDPLWKALLLEGSGCGGCVSGCSIGYNGLAVDSDGSVYPCRRLPILLGNATLDRFEDVWRHPALDRLRDRDQLGGRCGACPIRWECGGCRAVALAINGHPLDEDPQCFRRTRP